MCSDLSENTELTSPSGRSIKDRTVSRRGREIITVGTISMNHKREAVLSLPTPESLKYIEKHNENMMMALKDRREHAERLPCRFNLGRFDYS